MGDRILYPPDLAAAEEQLITLRRKMIPELEPLLPKAGLALSGGGIRSATVALGILQALAGADPVPGEGQEETETKNKNKRPAAKLLTRFDYLSTVSGGGYMGSFFGSLFARRRLPAPAEAFPGGNQAFAALPRHQQVEWILTNDSSPSLRWLRENGRYLAPNGDGDVLLAISMLLRNWLSILVVMGTLALMSFLMLNVLAMVISIPPTILSSYWQSPAWLGASMWWSPWLGLPLLTLVFWALPAGCAYWLMPSTADHSNRQRREGFMKCVPTITVAVIGCAAAIAPIWYVSSGDADVQTTWVWAGFAIATVMLLAIWMRFRSCETSDRQPPAVRRRLTDWLTAGVTATAALLVVGLVDSCGRTLYAVWSANTDGGVTEWLGLALGALITFFASVQRFAPVLVASDRKRSPSLTIIAGVAAGVLYFSLLTVVSAAAHGITWTGHQPSGRPGERILASETTRTVPMLSTAASASEPGKVMAQLATTIAVVPNPTPRPENPSPHYPISPSASFVALGITWALTLSFLGVMSFVNNSSLATVYGARLTRSYLGASNADRVDGDERITDTLPTDDIPTEGRAPDGARYHPESQGGPIHLINVTINETVDGRSQLQQQDRKGVGMAFGPLGVSVGARHHATWTHSKKGLGRVLIGADLPATGFSVFSSDAEHLPEPLSLGQLVGISGAAFSTGIGSRTNVALSLLCGLFNVRTGYWWDSGTGGDIREAQRYLLHEWLARFPGTAWNRWYLSDGGHFENLACYELIRRRLPFILCCDNGEDGNGEYEDIGNLVRKARLDFGSEITFLDRLELTARGIAEPGLFGSLDDLRCRTGGSGVSPCSLACAALATIAYPDGTSGLLLLVKPAVIGDEPEDVRHYQRAHPAFPHEPTLDQFFDEAQWEAYRKLGQHMGTKLCRSGWIDRWTAPR